jgi:prolipoprotein diacylglyceryltransferase
MCSAFIIGLILAKCRTKKAGLNSDYIYDIFIAIIPLAVFGARLYYVAFNWDYYGMYPAQIIAIWNGGLAIHGGIIGGIIGLYIVCRIRKIPMLKMRIF